MDPVNETGISLGYTSKNGGWKMFTLLAVLHSTILSPYLSQACSCLRLSVCLSTVQLVLSQISSSDLQE